MFKRIASLFIVVLTVLSLSVNAFAVGEIIYHGQTDTRIELDSSQDGYLKVQVFLMNSRYRDVSLSLTDSNGNNVPVTQGKHDNAWYYIKLNNEPKPDSQFRLIVTGRLDGKLISETKQVTSGTKPKEPDPPKPPEPPVKPKPTKFVDSITIDKNNVISISLADDAFLDFFVTVQDDKGQTQKGNIKQVNKRFYQFVFDKPPEQGKSFKCYPTAHVADGTSYHDTKEVKTYKPPEPPKPPEPTKPVEPPKPPEIPKDDGIKTDGTILDAILSVFASVRTYGIYIVILAITIGAIFIGALFIWRIARLWLKRSS